MPDPGPANSSAAIDALIRERLYTEAAAACEGVLRSNPHDLHALSMLALAALHLGDSARAEAAMGRAVGLKPEDAGLRINHARTLAPLGEHARADAELESAKTLRPDWVEPWLVWSELATARGELHLAMRRAEATAMAFPADGDALLARALTLAALGRPEEAWPIALEARDNKPQSIRHSTEVAYLSNFVPGLPAAAVLEAHTHIARRLNRFQPVTPINATARALDGRPIRIGLVSPDFRDHSVAYFLEPILEHNDPAAAELFAYHTAPKEDLVTVRLRGRVPNWRSIAGMPAREQARTFAQDRLDLLIELAGHTEHNAVPAMRYRAAPVQATYLGYPNTTGLRTIDYRIVDSITDPSGETDGHCTERLWRLDPPFLCYRPQEPSPPVAAPPCLAEGRITFGSFNIARKLNNRTISLWARVLLAVPGSRLYLKSRGLDEAGFAHDLRSRFAGAGVDPSRVMLAGYVRDVDGHLGAYRALDIALDPAPYNGTTTTCEALWMGVPVITVAGDRHASRVGASLLRAIGLPELVASTEDELVSAAADLAGEMTRLVRLRETMRERMRSSPLCDGPAFCGRFLAAVHEMVRAGPVGMGTSG
ncbi:MAG: tetratricopeptide repeat protein [Phycisphaerae bacterium]|nr:tetratricopeptide repeat protein [Phycisphaerae bacterium]